MGVNQDTEPYKHSYHISKNLYLNEGFSVPNGIILHEYSSESQLTGTQMNNTKTYEPPN
jgi:hypothetical protein